MGVKISWTGWRRESLSIPWLLISLSGSLTCGYSDDLVCTENWKITRSHFRLAAFTRWLHTQHVIYEAGWAQTIGGKRAADQCMGKTHFIANGLFAVTQTQTQCQAQPLRPVSTAVSPCQLPVPRLSLYVCHLYIKRLKIQLETSNCFLTRFKTNQSITGTCPIFVSVNNLNISGLQMNCYLLIHHQSQSLTSFKYNCTPQMLLSKTQYSLLSFQWPNCLQWAKPVAI